MSAKKPGPGSLWHAIQAQGQQSTRQRSPGTTEEFFAERARQNQERWREREREKAAEQEAFEKEKANADQRAAKILQSVKAREKLNMGRGFRRSKKMPKVLLPGQVNNGENFNLSGENLNLEEEYQQNFNTSEGIPEIIFNENTNLLPPLTQARHIPHTKETVEWNNHDWENAVNRGIEAERQKTAANKRRRKSRSRKSRSRKSRKTRKTRTRR